MTTIRIFICGLAGATASTVACAQAFNIDFGAVGVSTPSTSYGAAANQAGYWNPGTGPLRDVTGAATSVTFVMGDVNGSSNTPIAGASADDSNLMGDDFRGASFSSYGAFTGFAPGEYRFFTYCWARGVKNVITLSIQDTSQTITATLNPINAWPGQAEGKTYFFHDLTITDPAQVVQFVLVARSVGENTEVSTAQGMQIVPLPSPGGAMMGAIVVVAGIQRRTRR